MTALNKQELRQTAEKAQEHGVFNMDIHSQTVLALLDENYRLTAERDALRENIGGDNTRAAADIYFQLVEECEIPPGGSLVGYIDDIKERLSNAENYSSELDNALCELLPGTQYIDPPDGGSVTPLEQVHRMVADYRYRIAELEEKQRLIDICQGQGLEHRIAAEKRAEASEKRIAELEAREVNLPAACADDEYFIDGVFQALRYERDVERSIRAAGIGVKGE